MNGRDFKIFIWTLKSIHEIGHLERRVSESVYWAKQQLLNQKNSIDKKAKLSKKRESNLIMLLRDLSSIYGKNYACQSLNR